MEFRRILKIGRAARDLSQEELASLSGVTARTISNLETSENQSASGITRRKILRAFEKLGLSFTETGFEMTDSPVYVITGDNEEACYLQLLEDVLDHLQDREKPELLIMYADDSVSPPSVNDMYAKMRRGGVQIRQLIEEGNSYILGDLDNYRIVPKQFFFNRVTLIYGERTANMTADLTRAIVRVDTVNAAKERNTFEMLWTILQRPEKTDAPQRF